MSSSHPLSKEEKYKQPPPQTYRTFIPTTSLVHYQGSSPKNSTTPYRIGGTTCYVIIIPKKTHMPPQYGHEHDQHTNCMSPQAAPSASATACGMKPRTTPYHGEYVTLRSRFPLARAGHVERAHLSRASTHDVALIRTAARIAPHFPIPRTCASPFPACCYPNAQHPLPARRGTTLAEQPPRERLESGNRVRFRLLSLFSFLLPRFVHVSLQP
jgi:hypothetical protein